MGVTGANVMPRVSRNPCRKREARLLEEFFRVDPSFYECLDGVCDISLVLGVSDTEPAVTCLQYLHISKLFFQHVIDNGRDQIFAFEIAFFLGRKECCEILIQIIEISGVNPHIFMET